MDDNDAQTSQTKKTVRIDNLNAETMEAAVIAAFKLLVRLCRPQRGRGESGRTSILPTPLASMQLSLQKNSRSKVLRARFQKRTRAAHAYAATEPRTEAPTLVPVVGESRRVRMPQVLLSTSRACRLTWRKNILEAFSKFGKISKVEMRSRRDGSCFAFVTFETEEQMRAAIETTDPIEVGNAAVEVEARRVQTKARVHHVPTSENSIYVRDFLENTTEEQLREHSMAMGTLCQL